MKNRIEVGHRFGRLTVIQSATKINAGSRWRCLCDCGETPYVDSQLLKSGGTKSCGCLRKETALRGDKSPVHKHGLAGSPIWSAWRDMKARCLNVNNPRYADYGGRGISVCERWMDAEKFIEDMLPSWSKGLQLDREDNDKGYSPENCRWATHSENQSNKRSNVKVQTPDGEMTIAQAARHYGLTHSGIAYRLSVGKSGADLVAKSARSK